MKSKPTELELLYASYVKKGIRIGEIPYAFQDKVQEILKEEDIEAPKERGWPRYKIAVGAGLFLLGLAIGLLI